MEVKKNKKLLFLDRDGVIVIEDQIDTYERIIYIPHVFEALRAIVRQGEYSIVMVSNQDGVGTPSFTLEGFTSAHNRIRETLNGEDIYFYDERIDFSLPSDNCSGRKPGIGMLGDYINGDYDIANSIVIGDRLTDVQLAKNIGCKAIWFENPKKEDQLEDLKEHCLFVSNDWLKIADFFTGKNELTHRKVEAERNTNETKISLELDLDGSGKGKVESGIGFFDHMMDQIIRHSKIDLSCEINGDLFVDEHHTVEDFALLLGESFKLALGDKKGINRYGSAILVMDEVVSTCAIDFSGRAELIFEADFNRDYINNFPIEMVKHFFKSFSNEAKCNLYIKVTDGNTHHQVEAIFKSFAKAVKEAIHKIPGSTDLPSTKGVL